MTGRNLNSMTVCYAYFYEDSNRAAGENRVEPE